MSTKAITANRPARAAFTLLELLAVLGLIALLSGLVAAAGRHASTTGKLARAKADLAAVHGALEAYRLTWGDYPRTDDPARLLQCLIGRRDPGYQMASGRRLIETERFALSAAGDPSTDETVFLLDPWGQSYRYAYKSETPWLNQSFVLYSDGPDQHATAILRTGGFPDRAAPGNDDNIHLE